MKINYYKIDIMKFIGAIMVVYMHTFPMERISIYIDDLNYSFCRIAVPFFFVASGFFFFSKLKFDLEDKDKLITYLRRIIELYLIWSVIYLPSTIVSLKGRGVVKVFITYIRNFTVVGSYYHLWYYPALIFSIWFIYILYRRFSIGSILILGLLLYSIGLLGNSYYALLPEGSLLYKIVEKYLYVFETTRNGLFEGTLFVGIGLYFSKNRIWIKRSTNIILLIFSTVALLLESRWILDHSLVRTFDLCVFMIPTVVLLVNLLLDMEVQNSINLIKLRNYSTLIFGIHKLFINLLLALNIQGIPLFFMTIILSMGFASIVMKISSFKRTWILHKIY